MAQFVAFLRGINVGGQHKMPMPELKKVFAAMGCREIKTFLATGNVVFEADNQSVGALAKKLEAGLKKKFGFQTDTIVLAGSAFRRLVEADPFKGVRVNENTRRYVTFFKQKPKHDLTVPYTSDDKSFRLVAMTTAAAFTVLDVSRVHTTDLMKFLEQAFGKNITTRNWNTIQKMK